MEDKIGILGLGQMGMNFVRLLSPHMPVFVCDLDGNKTNEAEVCFPVKGVRNMDDLSTMDMIILALPEQAVKDFFYTYYSGISERCICLNLCTFLSLDQIVESMQSKDIMVHGNIMSCKLIGHFNKMTDTGHPCHIIYTCNCKDRKVIDFSIEVLEHIGATEEGEELKYMKLNLMIAASVMKHIFELKENLFRKGFSKEITDTALKSVYTGTAEQYPYYESDYFLDRVMEEYPEIEMFIKNQ